MVSALPKTLRILDNGVLLKELRLRAGLADQRKAAAKLGYKSASALSERENDKTPTDIADVYRFAAKWGLTKQQVDEVREHLRSIDAEPLRPIADICASYGGLLKPLTDEQRRDLVPNYPVFVTVPDGTMSGKLERDDLAMVRVIPPDRIPRAAHGKVCYVVFTEASDQGEPEFGLVLEHDEDSIIIAKTEPGRGPATRVVPLSDIYNVGVVVGVYKAL
jgi:hypothetical protein